MRGGVEASIHFLTVYPIFLYLVCMIFDEYIWECKHKLKKVAVEGRCEGNSVKYLFSNCITHDFISCKYDLLWIYRYGHINVSTFHYPYQTHTSGGPIWINFFSLERYGKNSWDVRFGFFDFCVLWRLGPKTVFLGPLA